MNKLQKTQFFYPLLTLILGLFLVQFRVMGWDFSRIPGDLGDARFNMYLLEHAYQFTSGQWTEYWNAGFFFPALETIAYSDNLLGASPIYSFARMIGWSREGAFQFWILVVTILNFIAAYLLFFRMSRTAVGSALGAFVYAFSLVLFSQMYHVQTMPRFAIPLMLLFFYNFHKKGKGLSLVAGVWMLVWQFWCGIYLGFFTLFVGVSYILCSLPFYCKNYLQLLQRWKSLLFVGVNLIMSVLAMLKLMAPYMRRAEFSIPYTQERIMATVPQLGSYFYSTDDAFLWGVLSGVGDDWEWAYTQTLFIGGIALLSICTCFFLLLKSDFRRLVLRGEVFPFVITAFLSLIFFMKWGDFSLYTLLIDLPGFGALRSLDRMINVQLLFAGMALVGVLYYWRKYTRKWWVFGILLFAIGLDNYQVNVEAVTFAKQEAQERVMKVSKQLENLDKNAVVAYQPDSLTEPAIFYQLDAMLATQEHGLKSVNGYSATSPYGFDLFWRELNDAGRRKWMEMSGADTTHVVVIH